MHRMTQIVAGAAIIWIGLSLCSKAYNAQPIPPNVDPPHPPPKIERIRELAELTVLEVDNSTIVSTEIRGYIGGTSAVVLVHGTLTYGVNMDEATYLQVDEERRHIVLALPQPDVNRVAIDPRASQILSCMRTGLWKAAVGPVRETEALTTAFAIGHDRLKNSAASEDLMRRARRHAEAVLSRFLQEMGWTLEVRWDE